MSPAVLPRGTAAAGWGRGGACRATQRPRGRVRGGGAPRFVPSARRLHTRPGPHADTRSPAQPVSGAEGGVPTWSTGRAGPETTGARCHGAREKQDESVRRVTWGGPWLWVLRGWPGRRAGGQGGGGARPTRSLRREGKCGREADRRRVGPGQPVPRQRFCGRHGPQVCRGSRVPGPRRRNQEKVPLPGELRVGTRPLERGLPTGRVAETEN